MLPVPTDLAPAWHADPVASVFFVVALLPLLLLGACAFRIRRVPAALRSWRSLRDAPSIAVAPIGATVVVAGTVRDDHDSTWPVQVSETNGVTARPFTLVDDGGRELRVEPTPQLSCDSNVLPRHRVFVEGSPTPRAAGAGYREPSLHGVVSATAIAHTSPVHSAARHLRRVVFFALWPLVALLAIELLLHGSYLDRLVFGQEATATFTVKPDPCVGMWIDLDYGCSGILSRGHDARIEDISPCRWMGGHCAGGAREVPCLTAHGHVAQIGRRATEHWGRLSGGLVLALLTIALRDPRPLFRR
jgi:hypothetical protein